MATPPPGNQVAAELQRQSREAEDALQAAARRPGGGSVSPSFFVSSNLCWDLTDNAWVSPSISKNTEHFAQRVIPAKLFTYLGCRIQGPDFAPRPALLICFWVGGGIGVGSMLLGFPLKGRVEKESRNPAKTLLYGKYCLHACLHACLLLARSLACCFVCLCCRTAFADLPPMGLKERNLNHVTTFPVARVSRPRPPPKLSFLGIPSL